MHNIRNLLVFNMTTTRMCGQHEDSQVAGLKGHLSCHSWMTSRRAATQKNRGETHRNRGVEQRTESVELLSKKHQPPAETQFWNREW